MQVQIRKVDLVDIRSMLAEDHNFILATFLRGLYYGNSWFAEIPKDIFMANYHKVGDYLLAYPSVDIKVACLKEDPQVILGYSISRKVNETVVLDYVFVKSAWRNIGIGKSLVPKDYKSVSHLTKVGKALKPKDCVFNPFLIG